MRMAGWRVSGRGSEAGSAGVQVQVGGEVVADLEHGGQFRVPDDDHAVGEQGGPPIAAVRADRQQVDDADTVAVLEPWARLKMLAALNRWISGAVVPVVTASAQARNRSPSVA